MWFFQSESCIIKCCFLNTDHENGITVWIVGLLVKGSNRSTNSNLEEAFFHYREKSRSIAPASPVLIYKMKNHKTFKNITKKLKTTIKR